jgi:nucleotide-binding universal stress UspA family protein
MVEVSVYNKILVPLDGSALAECSLDHLKQVISGEKAPEIILLRVVEPLHSNDAAAWAQGGYTIAEVEKKAREEASNYLDQTTAGLARKGIQARSEVVFGRTAETILEYSARNGINLIIISTHGRSGISRWAFGSVADRVTRQAGIPVLLISAPGCRTVESTGG